MLDTLALSIDQYRLDVSRERDRHLAAPGLTPYGAPSAPHEPRNPVIEPIFVAQDRSMAIPPGWVVKTGYVPVGRVDMACRDRMAIGDVDRAYQRRLQLGGHQPWPPPRGHWEGERFVLVDGRHEFVAALMLGQEYLFVAWAEEPVS